MNSEQFEDIWAEFAAHKIVISELILRIQQKDPEFVQEIRRNFDATLGRMMKQKPEDSPETHKVKVRKAIMEILPRVEEPSPVTTLTFRRRFLNWLERG